MLSDPPSLLEVRTVLTRLLPRPEGQDPDKVGEWERTIGREMALYSALPAELRKAVDERLRAIVGLPPARRAADVADAARSIGLSQSAMYGLLKRVHDAGPVTGLIPGRRREGRPSAARDGFGPPVDDWIATSMSEQPNIPIADVGRWIAAEIHNLERLGQPAPKPPAASALRERVHALRNRRPPVRSPEVGLDLLVDQCRLSLRMGTRPGARIATGLFIVDRRTTLVLGAGLYSGRHAGFGLRSAIEDLRLRADSLARKGLVFPTGPATVQWVVPPVLAPRLSEVMNNARSHRLVDVHWITGRSGQELTRLIGERLGGYRLLPRARSEGMPSDVDDGGAPPILFSPGLAVATEGLLFEVDRRNRRMLEEAPGSSERRDRSEQDVGGYVRTLETIFEPALRDHSLPGR